MSPQGLVPTWVAGATAAAASAATLACALLAHRRQITTMQERLDALEDQLSESLTLTQQLTDVVFSIPHSPLRRLPRRPHGKRE